MSKQEKSLPTVLGHDCNTVGRVVLVGTYKGDQLTKWHGWYNYPISDKDSIKAEEFGRINELWLFNGTKSQKMYKAQFVGVKTRAELIDGYGYPAKGRSHGDRYLLFKIDFKYTHGMESVVDVERVIIRLKDFVTSPKIRKQLKAYLESTNRNVRTMADLLPSIVTTISPSQLCVCEAAYQMLQWDLPDGDGTRPEIPFPSPKNPKFTFIDLFAGIGGIRLGFQANGGKCVYSSEFDLPAQKTYEANFGDRPFGDITKQETKDAIPSSFDIICAGFPCQAFSLAGKKMGFEDNYKGMCRGTLFKEVVEICEKHKPKVVFCENVKGLLIHDKGRTLKVIQGAFEEIGYRFFYTVLNSKDFGVPQHRERLYMVALRNDILKAVSHDNSEWTFPFPKPSHIKTCLQDIRQTDVSARYYLSTTYVETLRRHKARHEALGHGFGYEIRDWNGVAGAIVCGGMGRERNLVIDKTERQLIPETHIKGGINHEGIRKMTPREWARLQGFPEEFKFVLSDGHLYKQFGNSVSVPVVQAIANNIVSLLDYAKGKVGENV